MSVIGLFHRATPGERTLGLNRDGISMFLSVSEKVPATRSKCGLFVSTGFLSRAWTDFTLR